MRNVLPELLFFSGVLSRRQDGVEDIFSVSVALGIGFAILSQGIGTFEGCFLPELETRTGLEYLTRLWGWLKLAGPWLDDMCNLFDLNKYTKDNAINSSLIGDYTNCKDEGQLNEYPLSCTKLY